MPPVLLNSTVTAKSDLEVFAEQLSRIPHTPFITIDLNPGNACVYYAWLLCINGGAMRTNIVIDDKLMQQALDLSGLGTKKAVVEEALKLLIQLNKQWKIRDLRGKLSWDGNLDDMRFDS